jgi:hypothetical protein
VKLSKKVRFPLDTQKEYLNREWPHEFHPSDEKVFNDFMTKNP